MEKERWEESEKRREEERRSEKRTSQKKEDAGARKGRKVTVHCVFPMFCVSGGSKSRLAKASHLVLWEMEHFTPLWREARFEEVKMLKASLFGALLEVQTLKKCTLLWREAHWEVKRCRNISGSERFWKLRCAKSARRCGAKHISKSNCTKHTMLGALLEVEMSKTCTVLWCEAHFEVNMWKTRQVRTTFGSWHVQKVDAVVARSCTTLHYATLHHTALHYTRLC